jgi:hypothetical protein
MSTRRIQLEIFTILLMVIIIGCASFRSEIDGRFRGEATRNIGANRVKALFIFSHVRQISGLDAVPKIENKNDIIMGFDDLFMDGLKEFSNIGQYATYTEFASDVNHPERRAQRDSLIAASDYLVKIRFTKEKRFSSFFLKIIMSSFMVTLLPLPYTQSYSMETEVYDNQQILISTYRRDAKLTEWVQPALILVYPFYPQERIREEIYKEFLHDTFRQIESERLLKG